jgi:endogenous inhibitor of DNA gyrase (YacG/DUF329 family)
MQSTRPTLGDCPLCGRSIPRERLLIEYDTSDGQSMYAECPDCRKVVHPVSQ